MKNAIILCYSEQNVRIVFTFLQSVHALGLPLRSGLQEHGLSPQDAFEGENRVYILKLSIKYSKKKPFPLNPYVTNKSVFDINT